MNLYETQVINRKAAHLALQIRRSITQANCAAESYQMAWRGLVEMVDIGLHTSDDPTDHYFFSAGVEAFFNAAKHLAEYPCCGIANLDSLEYDEYAAYLTVADNFRVEAKEMA